ncbi:MAG: DUF6790 family protein [Candidatus Promineifilaceae bacterium]|nr:DUF6790 family protein [Candidatus Promineifilaceae bacterium]
MNEVFLGRIFAYSVLPLLLAAAHIILDRQARTPARRIELIMLYLFAISLGASGLGGAFGHLFLSDQIAASIGWTAGSPFQLEMGFANLAIGVLGIAAISQRDGFRTAAILATTIIGFGATYVHLQDIVAHGNLAPGNTIQNISNLLDPLLLIVLTWLSRRMADPDAESPAFLNWQFRQQPIVTWAAIGVGTGFGVGFFTGAVFLWTIVITLAAIGIGIIFSRRLAQGQESHIAEQQ